MSNVPISQEFRFASIYEEVKRIRDQTAQNDVGGLRSMITLPSSTELIGFINQASERSWQAERPQMAGPLQPAFLCKPLIGNTQPRSSSRSSLRHPQPQYHSSRRPTLDVFDSPADVDPKGLEPYHILPPPPPPPPPPSPTSWYHHSTLPIDSRADMLPYDKVTLGAPFSLRDPQDRTSTPTRDSASFDSQTRTKFTPKAGKKLDVTFEAGTERPDSPWSADSGIEISPPRPVKPRSKPIDGPGTGDGKRIRGFEVELGSEFDEGVGWIEEDERTWRATFGSPNLGGIYGKDIGSEGEITIEVEEWCPGGEACRHYDDLVTTVPHHEPYGWIPMTPPGEFGGLARDYPQYESGFTVGGKEGIVLPDAIIEPDTPLARGPLPLQPPANLQSTIPSQTIPIPLHHMKRTACPSYPLEPLFDPFNPPPSGFVHPDLLPLPLSLGAPMLLHSPGLSPRPLSFGQYLYLQDHYSYNDPLLGKKGAWKCSLCDCGSREPLGFVRSGPWETPVEISELGMPSNRIMLSRLGFEVDLKKDERVAERRYARTQRGQGHELVKRGRVRSVDTQPNPNYIKLGPRRITRNAEKKVTVSEAASSEVTERPSTPCDTIEIDLGADCSRYARRHSYQGIANTRIECDLEIGDEDSDWTN